MLIKQSDIPGFVKSTKWKVEVDGNEVLVDRIGKPAGRKTDSTGTYGGETTHYCRFVIQGQSSVKITRLDSSDLSKISLWTPGDESRLNPTKELNYCWFSLDIPRKIFIKSDESDYEPLVICAEYPEVDAPKITDTNVLDFGKRLSLNRDTKVPVTTELQKALVDASIANQILYIPDGLFVSSQIKLPSNTKLYLSSGARLQANPDTSGNNYPDQNGLDSSFIFAQDASNILVYGRGTIDGNGREIDRLGLIGGIADGNGKQNNIKLFRTANCTNVLVNGISFRDSARWSINPIACTNVVFQNVKLINDIERDSINDFWMNNTDGIDPDSCDNVLIDDCLVITCDDACSPKTVGYMGYKKTSNSITLKNSLFWCWKSGIKVGDEIQRQIQNISVVNCLYLFVDRVMALWNNDPNVGGTPDPSHGIRNVDFLSNRVCSFHDQGSNKAPFMLRVKREPSQVSNINVNCFEFLTDAKGLSRIGDVQGFGTVTDVKFTSIYRQGKPLLRTDTGAYPRPSDVFGLEYRGPSNQFGNISFSQPGSEQTLVNVFSIDPLAYEDQGLNDSGCFLFVRSGSLEQPLRVFYNLSGSAVANTDYESVEGFVDIPAGKARQELKITPKTTQEANTKKNIQISILVGMNYALGKFANDEIWLYNLRTQALQPPVPPIPVTKTIVSVGVADGSASEAINNQNPGKFFLTRDNTKGSLIVNVEMSGKATNGTDYNKIGPTLMFPDGVAKIFVPVLVIPDNIQETIESVVMTIVNGDYQIGTASAKVDIINVN